MEQVKGIIELAGIAIDVVGVLVILIGILFAGSQAIRSEPPNRYRVFRHGLGKAILLGLEFMVAGDIVRTVAIEPNMENVAVLIGIVFIRTFLSFSLQVELDGRWPWQRKSASAE